MLAAMNAWGTVCAPDACILRADLQGDPSEEDLDQYPRATAK